MANDDTESNGPFAAHWCAESLHYKDEADRLRRLLGELDASNERLTDERDTLRRLLAEACSIAYQAIEDNAAAMPTTASERVQEIRHEAGLGETGDDR